MWDQEGHIVTNFHGNCRWICACILVLIYACIFKNKLSICMRSIFSLSRNLNNLNSKWFHIVVGSALSRNLNPGQVVARVNILTSDGYVYINTLVMKSNHFIINKLIFDLHLRFFSFKGTKKFWGKIGRCRSFQGSSCLKGTFL